ncbi:MAG: DUF4143 domain-containing protein [Lachnospiraceae bacterium]|nr:DUF4143 domain-containing protein [Lachnospiraceae bacterium]
MDENSYRPRIIDKSIDEYLGIIGAVSVEGPKWCGKTWTSVYHSNSTIMLADPANNFANRESAKLSLDFVLTGTTPRLIDEWQEVPPIWDAVRYEVDKRGENGQFILTGSSTPNHKGILHSGAGRIAKLHMHPMSLFESGDSTGQVSIKEIIEGKFKPVLTGEVDLNDLLYYIIRGGWPKNIGIPVEKAIKLPIRYIEAIISDDLYRIDGVKRDLDKMNLLLRSLARNESTTVTNNTLIKDIKNKDDGDINKETISDYLNIFERLYLINNQLPFATHIRSSARIKKAVKRHFCDPSLACALLGATPVKLLRDLETTGFLFEALCERDLQIYAEAMEAKLYHYQDYKNREIDAVIETYEGDWMAIEIKLGAIQIDGAAENLIKLRDSMIEDEKAKPPKWLVVICGLTNAAYQRADGVYVIPITSLKD